MTLDPLQNPPSFEKPVGELAGANSRRINIHNRLLYEILLKKPVVPVLRLATHHQ